MQEPNTLMAETSPLTEGERSAVFYVPPVEPDDPPWGPPLHPAVQDIVHGGYGVTPLAGKRPLRSGWQVEPIRSGLEWIDSGHAGNHGIVLREADRLLLVDVDVKGDRDGREAFTELVNAVNLDVKRFLVQRTPSGGFHLLGRIPADYPASKLPNGAGALPGVDVLRDRKQFVRAPGVTEAGEYQEVFTVRRPHGEEEGLLPLEALPEWPVAILDALADASGGGSSTEARPPEDLEAPSVDWVREAVRQIRNGPGFESRAAWQKMASAIKAAVGPANEEEGLRIFAEFSARWEDGTNDPGETERLYRTSPTGRIGWQWLAELSGETAALAVDAFEADPDAELPERSEPAGGEQNLVARYAEALEEIEYTGPPGFLLDRLILASDINFLAGEDGSWKTTIAIAMACAVASGSDLFGFRNPNGPRRVLYFSEEDDKNQIKNKADAIVAGSDLEIPPDFLKIIALRGFTFGNERWEKDLRSYLRDGGYGLVILDPLAEMQTGKENSNDDARPIIRFLRSITARGGPAVLVVHHAGKSSEGKSKVERYMRGASAFKAGARCIVGAQKRPDGFLLYPLKLSRTATPDVTSVKARITLDPEDEDGIRWERATFEGAPRWKIEREEAEWEIRSVLEEAGTLNSTTLRDEVARRGHKPPAVSKARDVLERRGVIDFKPGEYGAKMWYLVEPEIPVEEGVGIPEDSD